MRSWNLEVKKKRRWRGGDAGNTNTRREPQSVRERELIENSHWIRNARGWSLVIIVLVRPSLTPSAGGKKGKPLNKVLGTAVQIIDALFYLQGLVDESSRLNLET